MRQALKKLLRLLFGNYRIFRVYALDLSTFEPIAPTVVDVRALSGPAEMESAAERKIREHAWFAGGDASVFGAFHEGSLVCACVLWDAHRYRDDAVGPISRDEAVLVDVVTDDAHGRRGFASAVLRFAASEKKKAGYRRLICTVWHNNQASIRTFKKAGWRYEALSVEIFPLGGPIPLRFRWRKIHERH